MSFLTARGCPVLERRTASIVPPPRPAGRRATPESVPPLFCSRAIGRMQRAYAFSENTSSSVSALSSRRPHASS